MNMSYMAPESISSDAPASVEKPQADHTSEVQAKAEQLARILTFLSNVDTKEGAGCRGSLVGHMKSTPLGRLILENADTFHTGEYYAHQDQICEEPPQTPGDGDATAKAEDPCEDLCGEPCIVIGSKARWTKRPNKKKVASSTGHAQNRTKFRGNQAPSVAQWPKATQTEIATMRRNGKQWTER